jgi:twinkle protein
MNAVDAQTTSLRGVCCVQIITEGEFDAMAAHQATGLPAISLPNGANSLPLELMPELERFKRIYLWMDDDTAGRAGAEKFAQKLGLGRVLIVTTNPLPHETAALAASTAAALQHTGQSRPKDANDCLLMGVDMRARLDAARPLPHKQITNFSELRDAVFTNIKEPMAARYPVLCAATHTRRSSLSCPSARFLSVAVCKVERCPASTIC